MSRYWCLVDHLLYLAGKCIQPTLSIACRSEPIFTSSPSSVAEFDSQHIVSHAGLTSWGSPLRHVLHSYAKLTRVWPDLYHFLQLVSMTEVYKFEQRPPHEEPSLGCTARSQWHGWWTFLWFCCKENQSYCNPKTEQFGGSLTHLFLSDLSNLKGLNRVSTMMFSPTLEEVSWNKSAISAFE